MSGAVFASLSSVSVSLSSANDDFVPAKWEKYGGFMVYFAMMCYVFLGFEVICETFFVPALNVFCEKLHMSDDFAGATLMALGGNAPDIFSGIVGVLILKTDVGMGTIVGSLLFNHLAIIGCTAIAVRKISLDLKSLSREVIFYTLAIILMLATLYDSKVTIYESSAHLVLYVIYVVVCALTPWLSRVFTCRGRKGEKSIFPSETSPLLADHSIQGPDVSPSPGSPSLLRNVPRKPLLITATAPVSVAATAPVARVMPRPVVVRKVAPATDVEAPSQSEPAEKETAETAGDESKVEVVVAPDEAPATEGGEGTEQPVSPTPVRAEASVPIAIPSSPTTVAMASSLSTTPSRGSRRDNSERLRQSLTMGYESFKKSSTNLAYESGTQIGLTYGTVQMHGFLLKKSRWYTKINVSSRQWQRRWFVLDEKFWYTRNPLYPEKRVEIPLWKAWKIAVDEEDPLEFNVSISKSTITFRAATADMARKWVRALKDRVHFMKEMNPDLYNDTGLVEIEEDDDESLLKFPSAESFGHIAKWALQLPWSVLFTFTIPDVKKPRFRNFFVLTFVMVLVWLSGMAFTMIWAATRFAMVLGIPDDIMGLTITAIGASLPSLFGSIIAARQGFANMAISNAFGANLCSILLAFGLPCFIENAFVHPGKAYECASGAILTTVAVLFVALVVFIIITAISRLKLTWAHGSFFLFLYAALLTSVVVLQVRHIDVIAIIINKLFH